MWSASRDNRAIRKPSFLLKHAVTAVRSAFDHVRCSEFSQKLNFLISVQAINAKHPAEQTFPNALRRYWRPCRITNTVIFPIEAWLTLPQEGGLSFGDAIEADDETFDKMIVKAKHRPLFQEANEYLNRGA